MCITSGARGNVIPVVVTTPGKAFIAVSLGVLGVVSHVTPVNPPPCIKSSGYLALRRGQLAYPRAAAGHHPRSEEGTCPRHTRPRRPTRRGGTPRSLAGWQAPHWAFPKVFALIIASRRSSAGR